MKQTYENFNGNQHVQIEKPKLPGYIIGGSLVILLAVVFWQVTILATLGLGAAYGIKTIVSQPRPVVAEVQETETVKPKRHYKHRIKVNYYDSGKQKTVVL